MTKIAFCADVHAGNHKRLGGAWSSGLNRRCLNVLGALERAAAQATRLRCDAFVILGDLFDGSKPSPQIIAAVETVLRENAPRSIVLLGNHDLESTEPGDHALGPLSHVSGIEVVDTPTVLRVQRAGLGLIPFLPGDARQWVRESAERIANQMKPFPCKLVCLHVGVSDEATPFFLKDAQDAVPVELVDELCHAMQLDAAIAGNWHRHVMWPSLEGGPPICQLGTVAPTGFDDAGFEGVGVMGVWSDESPREFKILPVSGPRFITLQSTDEAEVLQAFAKRMQDDQIYLRFKVTEDKLNDAKALAAQLKEQGHVEEFAVELVGKDNAGREAAAAAQSVTLVQEKIAAYVEKVAKGDGERARRVLGLVDGFLASASEE